MQPANHKSTKRLRRRPLGRYRYVRLRWRIMFTLIDTLGAMLFASARLLRRSFASAASEINYDPLRILLIQLDHMGDAIITTVMLPLLRRRYPQASIEVLCGPWNRELFESIGHVDRVHVSRLNRFLRGDSRSFFTRFAWAGAVFAQGLRLRRCKFDLGIDVRGEFPHALMLWLAGVRRRLGWTCGGGGFMLTDTAPFVPDRPEVDSRLALLEQLGIKPADGSEARPRYNPTSSSERSVASMLDELGLHEQTTRVALHVSAGTTAKRWPVEHWRTLLDMLKLSVPENIQLQVVLIGGSADRQISRHIIGDRDLDGVVDLTGRLNVVELAALLQRVDLLIGGDSGPAHLAAAVGTPVVALFSGTNNHRQWQPCGPDVVVLRHPVDCSPCHRHQCPLAGHPCMHKLEPASVARAAGQYISLTGLLQNCESRAHVKES
ncbi:MAG: glycosyltransferase family 9 protein [Pirellulales bacterium]|nr:glycosyltransferase family 9 protein [Pirellulales bacterium]